MRQIKTQLPTNPRLNWLDQQLRAVPRFRNGFRCAEQAEIALAYHDGQPTDVLGVLPTAMGKSLCFLLPTHLWARENGRALTVVVSPLIALMMDMVDGVERHSKDIGDFNLKAAQLNSSVDVAERRRIRRSIRDHELNLLFLGPETLVQPWTYEMLADAARAGTLRGLVVDEAHMIIEWGSEFRPDFRRIGPIRKLLQEAAPPDQPLRTLLLTATLPPEYRAQVMSSLGVEDGIRQIEHRAIRGEHYLRVLHFASHVEKLKQLAKDVRRLRQEGAGIIYCAMRKHCEEIAEVLNTRGLGTARYFHGGTPPDIRREILRDFRNNRLGIVVATDAFGLGVHKRDVRWVLHFSMPESIDQYYQEIGRGGRDGKSCEALLYYSPGDKRLGTNNMTKVLSTEKFYARLRAMREGASTLSRSRHATVRLMEEQTVPDYSATTKNKASLRLHTTWNYAVLVRAHELGWIVLGPDVIYEATCFLAPRATVASAERSAPLLAATGLLQTLRRDGPTKLELGAAAAKHKLDIRDLQREFFDLILEGKIILPREGPAWNTRVLIKDRTNRNTERLSEDVRLRLNRQRAGRNDVELMATYAKSTKRCRRTHFFKAYGYDDLIPANGCGNCDVCLGKVQ